MKKLIVFLMVSTAGLAGAEISPSKDSLQVYNQRFASYADGITLLSRTTARVHMDSALLTFDEFDTAGMGAAAGTRPLEAQWKESNDELSVTFFSLTKSSTPLRYIMKQRPSAISNPVPLGFNGPGSIRQIFKMEIGTCLDCSGVPAWNIPYLKGSMTLYFNNGEILVIRLMSVDNRQPESVLPCSSYTCDSTIVRKILDINEMADVPVKSFSSVVNNRITTLRLFYDIMAAVSLPKQLTILTNDIGRLSALRLLDISGNNLTSLPAGLGRLTELTNLDAASNQLTSIPDSISLCHKLKYLILDKNQIEHLPSELSNNRSLYVLSVTDNRLTTLPSSFEELDSVNCLFIAGNRICSLPQPLIAWKSGIQEQSLCARPEPVWPDSQKCDVIPIRMSDSRRSTASGHTVNRIRQSGSNLVITSDVTIISLQLFDAAGRMVVNTDFYRTGSSGKQVSLSTGNIVSGIYCLAVTTKDARCDIRRLFVGD